MKNKTTAALLAFFFGALGVHRFYLGQTGLGVLYLLFCWISWIVAFVDTIVFLTMDESTFDAKYNAAFMTVRGPSVGPGAVPVQRTNPTIRSGGSSAAIAEELKKLNELREKGILTEAEFQTRKAILLNR